MITLNANDYGVQILLTLNSEIEIPQVGAGLLIVGHLAGLLRLRVFAGDGTLVADVLESKKEPEYSPIHELSAFLRGNNGIELPLNDLGKREICRIATTVVRGAKIDLIIEQNEGLWRDDRIRDWLLGQFKNKCWYSEAYDAAASIHVDHYRPKGRVKQELGSPTEGGYWWLAFEWRNYRICGQLLNVKKGDLFPIIEGSRCTHDSKVSLELEAPTLIDPLSDQTRLISYEKDEDGCNAVVAAGIAEPDITRAKKTIEIMGLNLRPRLNEKRNVFWDKCMMKIEEYKSAPGTQALRLVAQASAKAALKEMVNYDSEFSSVSEACIRKNAPESLIASVFANDDP